MKAYVQGEWLKSAKVKSINYESLFRYERPGTFKTIDLDRLTKKELELMSEAAKAAQLKYKELQNKGDADRSFRAYLTINARIKSLSLGSESVIKRVDQVPDAMRALMKDCKRKWVFKQGRDGFMLPYFITEVEYHRPRFERGHYYPAYVSFEGAATRRMERMSLNFSLYRGDLYDITAEGKAHDEAEGKLNRFSFIDQEDLEEVSAEQKRGIENALEEEEKKDIKGAKWLTMREILRREGYYVETPELVETYLKEIEEYQKAYHLLGSQYTAGGMGFSILHKDDDDNAYRYWRYQSNDVMFLRDGNRTKVIIDDSYKSKESDEVNATAEAEFWTESTTTVVVPLHPYIQIFDLEEHTWASIHINNLQPYEYDTSLADKLILPKDEKELIEFLVEAAGESLGDIITGKSSGTIIIGTGPAGTGKTLTAQVYSEVLKRPLYEVQCSQLGTDEEALEKNLKYVLRLASRWSAVLLMDEADVYIRARGDDLQQNAIVGIFLRLLEYYRGVLFMTSNRPGLIDDAIMSRATAWIKYVYPDKKMLPQIWKVHANNFQIDLTAMGTLGLVEAFPHISPRSVKTLLRLAKMLSAKSKKPITIEMLKSVARFKT